VSFAAANFEHIQRSAPQILDAALKLPPDRIALIA
jgi:hypothetical protein